jgi:hypothetical protein
MEKFCMNEEKNKGKKMNRLDVTSVLKTICEIQNKAKLSMFHECF